MSDIVIDPKWKNLPKLYNNKLNPEFNRDDFIKKVATLDDISDFANVNEVNTFINVNLFTQLFADKINNISADTIAFIKNLRSDAQQQIDNVMNTINNNTSSIVSSLVNFVYFSDSNTQSFKTNLNCPNINTNKFETNSLISNNLNSNIISSNTFFSETIKSNNIYSNNIPMIYINQTFSNPVIKSGLISRLQLDLSQPIYVTIFPSHQIIFYNSLYIPIANVNNSTNDIIYNVMLNIPSCISFEIFKNI
jgi:hypothetical protein